MSFFSFLRVAFVVFVLANTAAALDLSACPASDREIDFVSADQAVQKRTRQVFAACLASSDCLAGLVADGEIDFAAKTADGDTVVFACAKSDYPNENVPLLMAAGATPGPVGWPTALALLNYSSGPCPDAISALVGAVPLDERLAYINAADEDGATALHRAALAYSAADARAASLSALVELGADVTAADNTQRTALFMLNFGADASAAVRALAAGVDEAEQADFVNSIDEYDFCPVVVLAAQQYDLAADPQAATLAALAEVGADMGYKIYDGSSLLMMLNYAQGNLTNAIEIILTAANVPSFINDADTYGYTALYKAAHRLDIRTDPLVGSIFHLLKRGADPSLADSFAQTPLMMLNYASGDLSDAINMLINALPKEQRLDYVQHRGELRQNTALTRAVAAYDPNTDPLAGSVVRLIERGSCVADAKLTTLSYTNGDVSTVIELLVDAVDDDERDAFIAHTSNGATSLYMACFAFDPVLDPMANNIRALVEIGVNPSQADGFGRAPLHVMGYSNGNSTAAIDALLHQATPAQRRQLVNTRDELGNTPIFEAAAQYHSETDPEAGSLLYLIELGADVEDLNSLRQTPLMTLRFSSTAVPAIRVLVDHVPVVRQAAYINQPIPAELTNAGRTAVFFAAEKFSGREAVVELIRLGADPCLTDDSDATPAAIAGNTDVRAMLHAVCSTCTAPGEFYDIELDACVVAPSGHFAFLSAEAPGAGVSSQPCPPGFRCTSGLKTACTGTNYARGGAVECDECAPPARVVVIDGLNVGCAACEAGKYQPATGEAVCLGCPAGRYCLGGAAQPGRCATGERPTTDRTTCTLSTASVAGIVCGVAAGLGGTVALVLVVLRRCRTDQKANLEISEMP